MKVLLAAALLAPAMAAAEPGAIAWLRGDAGSDMAAREVGDWHPKGGAVHAIDPLTLLGGEGAPIGVPDRPARVFGLRVTGGDPRTAAMILVWSDAMPVCGADLATIGVDTGLAAFATPQDVAGLRRYEAARPDLYDGPYADQIDTRYPGPFLVDLPQTSGFPLSGSGWGDGGYPVASLIDAGGDMVALYAQFIPAGEDWRLPPPCADETS